MSRRPNSIRWPLGIVLAMLLSACAPAATPTALPTVPTTVASTATPTLAPTSTPTAEPLPTPIVLTDGLDRRVTLAALPQRIISLAPSNTEILFAIGAPKQVVGRDDFSDYPPEVAAVASIGSVYGELNAEAIVTLKPDLILAAEINSPEQIKTLEDLGLTVYWLANPTDFDGLYENLIIVGQLTGHEAEARELADNLKARVDAAVEKASGADIQPKVFYEIDGSDPTRPWTSGPGTFMDAMIRLAGGENVGAALSEPFAQISSEELVKQDPDIIVLGDTNFGVTVESIAQRAGWETITAVKNGAVYPFDDNLASRPGPRLVDGLEALAALLHPELFK